MSIEAIAALASPMPTAATSSATQSTSPADNFARWMVDEVHELNQHVKGAEQSLAQLATGQAGNLHEVMLDLEKARLAFQLTLQVRNKLLEGYQDIMRMQI